MYKSCLKCIKVGFKGLYIGHVFVMWRRSAPRNEIMNKKQQNTNPILKENNFLQQILLFDTVNQKMCL